MSLVQARHRSHWPIKDSGHGEAQRDYSAGPLRTRVLCALALHAFSGRCELTDLLTSRFGGAVLERPLPYATRMADRSQVLPPAVVSREVPKIIITTPCVTAAAPDLTPVRARLLPQPHRPQRTKYTTSTRPLPTPGVERVANGTHAKASFKHSTTTNKISRVDGPRASGNASPSPTRPSHAPGACSVKASSASLPLNRRFPFRAAGTYLKASGRTGPPPPPAFVL